MSLIYSIQENGFEVLPLNMALMVCEDESGQQRRLIPKPDGKGCLVEKPVVDFRFFAVYSRVERLSRWLGLIKEVQPEEVMRYRNVVVKTF